MKIAIHASHLCQDREDGNQTYMLNVFRNFAKIDSENQYRFYYNTSGCKQVEAPNFEHIVDKSSVMWTQRVFPFLLKRDKPDVLFMPIQMLPFLKDRKQKSVVTIHDLAFLYYPETFPKKDVILHKLYVREAITQADALIAITQATKDDIVKEYKVRPEKIHVVYHGVDTDRFHMPQDTDMDRITQVKEKYAITKPYLLYVGNVQPRKNVQGLVKAFIQMKRQYTFDIQLVIAGAKAWMVEEVMKDIGEISNDDILFTGRFADEELPPLLWGAQAFVLPSLYEGFGLPILEAMACGTPTFVSNTPSLVEVAGEAGVVLNHHDIVSMSEMLYKTLSNSQKLATMSQKGLQRAAEFSWETCARQTLTVISQQYESPK